MFDNEWGPLGPPSPRAVGELQRKVEAFEREKLHEALYQQHLIECFKKITAPRMLCARHGCLLAEKANED